MQVNRIDDQVTHAVLSPNTVRGAQISESAEFFSVLSSTLYSNKKLAVIREVLCNAWDIHIQEGLITTAVVITLTDDKITVRDFGTGIHDDHIVDVYLTYGNSTKKLDGTQTGGFGLGSKSPWAVVDHFEVESFHQGTKTEYTMSKSSGEVGGKPSATPMYSIPTKESGLKVSFAIQPGERGEYEKLIRMIASFGEMNVELNGDPIPVFEFSKAPHKMLLVERNGAKDLPEGTSRDVFVRYGNVVYPIPADRRLDSKIAGLQNEIRSFGGGDYRTAYKLAYVLILQAKPNTISVTPSRESLSMTEVTVKALDELMDEANASFFSTMHINLLDITREAVQTSWLHTSPAKLLTSNNKVPFQKTSDAVMANTIATPRDAGMVMLRHQYPNKDDFIRADTLARLDALIQSGFGNRGKIQSFRKAYARSGHPKTLAKMRKWDKALGAVDASNWFQRVMVLPLVRKMQATDFMVPKNLMVRGKHHDPKRQSWRNDRESLTEATKLSRRELGGYLPFLRNIVVLAFNRLDVFDRLKHIPAMDHWYGSDTDLFVYTVSRVAGKSEAAKKFFEEQGMYVIDLTIAHPHEHETVVLPEPKPVVVKPRKKGLIKAVTVLEPDPLKRNRGQAMSYALIKDEEAPRTEDVKTFIQANLRADRPFEASSPNWLNSSDDIRRAIDLFADDHTGIVANANQAKRFTDLGAKNFYDVVLDEIKDGLKNNAKIRKALTQQYTMFPNSWDYVSVDGMLSTIKKNKKLAKAFGFNALELTPKEQFIVNIGVTARYRDYPFPRGFLRECQITDNDIQYDPEYLQLAKKLKNGDLMTVFNFSIIQTIFGAGSTPSPALKKKQDTVIDLLMYAIGE